MLPPRSQLIKAYLIKAVEPLRRAKVEIWVGMPNVFCRSKKNFQVFYYLHYQWIINTLN